MKKHYTMEVSLVLQQSEISRASDAEIVASYRALTGRDIGDAPCRAVLERKIAHAIMLGEQARAHHGVAPNQKIVAATLEERMSWTPMAMELARLGDRRPPEPERPRRAPSEPRAATSAVVFVGVTTGRSRLQENSDRARVHAFLLANGPATAAELDKHFGFPTRPFLNKLRNQGHVEVKPK